MNGERKDELPRGAYQQIARRLRPPVSPGHVRYVYLGERTSPRVQRAIDNYVARLKAAELQQKAS